MASPDPTAPVRGRGARFEDLRRPRSRWPRRCLAASLVLCVLILAGTTGCARLLGPKIVEAPNHGKTARAVGASDPKVLRAKGVDRQLFVKVGPPEASLSLWVFEPVKKKVWVDLHKLAGQKLDFQFDQSDRPRRGTDEPLGTIIVLHGIYDKNEGYNGIWGRIFAAAGYRTILVDLRGHGRSTGDWLTYGVVESRDISQVIDALEKEKLVSGRLGVFGISYGGAVAIQSAAIDPRIDAITTVGSFASLKEVVPPFGKRYVTNRLGDFGWLALQGFVPSVIYHAGEAANFDPDDASPLDAIAKTDTPVMLIHGKADQHVPYQQAVELHEAARGHTKLVLIPRATHLSVAIKRVDQVRRLSLEWFDEHLITDQPTPIEPPKIASTGAKSGT